MKHVTRSRALRGLAALILATVCLTACNRLSDGAVSTSTSDTFNAAGEPTWAANTGPQVGGAYVTEASIQASLPAGWTYLTGAQAFTTSGTSSAQAVVLQNAYVYGCIAVKGDYQTYRNVEVVWDGSSVCLGGTHPNSGAGSSVIDPGIDKLVSSWGPPEVSTPVTPPQGTILDHVEVDAGAHSDRLAVGPTNVQVLHSNLHGGYIIVYVQHDVLITDSYIHDVSDVHKSGCTGYNNYSGACPGEDFHRDTIWAQGAKNFALYDSYVIHGHKGYRDASHTNDYVPGSSGGCLCDGPQSNVLISNVYFNGGSGVDILGPHASNSASKVVWEHVRVDAVDHTTGAPWVGTFVDGPCKNADYASGAWPGGSSISNSYYSDNSTVDSPSAGSETFTPC